MKTVSCAYFNDEQKPITVRVLDEAGNSYFTLKACEFKVFSLTVEENHILYIKKWPDIVLISSLDPAILQGTPEPQGEGVADPA